MTAKSQTNSLYYGDNLDVMRRYIADESVDLVYLDPPFKSDQDYNVLFAEHSGERAAAQIKAFKDTWRWDRAAAEAYDDVLKHGGRIAELIGAMRGFLGESDIMAYLAMMSPRLIELHRVLKPTGSIYLHCDPTASHYLKLLMDAILGPRNFRNEIIWCYRKWSIRAGQFVRNHDVILFYSKKSGRGHRFNPLFVPVSAGTMKRWKGQKQQAYFEEGIRKATSKDDEVAITPMPDWWEISIINPNAAERLGYPTQKPEALLQRIINASSKEGDVVLDPFCGCGTAIAVALRLKRRWIGIDVTHLAIGLIRHRLHDAFGKQAKYAVIGEPTSLPDAQTLAEDDRHEFEHWALGSVGARRDDKKKGADKGIDGKLFFQDEPSGKPKQVIFSVKSGSVSVRDVRDLRGVIERDGAAIGVLITLEEPTAPMKKDAATGGFYQIPGFSKKYPRMQILTIEELLNRREVEMPSSNIASDLTFRKARREDEGENEHPGFL